VSELTVTESTFSEPATVGTDSVPSAVQNIVTVRLPTVLRPQAGGQASVEVGGSTVRELLANLVAAHPGIGVNILDEGGELRKFVNIYVDDEDVRFLDKLDTQVDPGVEVAILPAVAGG